MHHHEAGRQRMDFITQNQQVLIAAGVTLAVLIVALLLWRTVSPRMSGRRGQRLGISEYHELDKTRRLVLIRRDNVEHLILIGGPQDLVVESGISISSVATSYAPPQPIDAGPIVGSSRPAPRPAVFGERKPPPLRSVETASNPARPRDGDTE
jgi:flagellar protein FliO/FliZ